MKILTSSLAAGSLAALAFFGYKENNSIRSLFTAEAKVKTEVAVNVKKDIYIQSAEQLQQSAPVMANTKIIEITQQPATANFSENQSLVSNEAADKLNTTSVMPHSIVISYKQPNIISRTIDMSKLTKKLATAGISLNVNTENTAVDSTEMNEHTVAGTKLPEQEFKKVAQQKAIIAPALVAPKKLVTITNEEPAIAAMVKTAAHTTVAAEKTDINTDKAAVKANVSQDMNSFASSKQVDNGADTYSYSSLSENAEQLREFAETSGSNAEFAIIVNLAVKSGKKRFFVVALASNTIIKSGVVAEGSGDVYSTYEKRYSNEMGSMSSALGIYKIGKQTKTGLSYPLFGLQETNSNAVKNSIMLQASEEVPYEEKNQPLFKTNGSLSLSARFLKEISPMLNESTKPVLMWVYDSAADNQAAYSSK